jgi:acyl carrier protein
MASKVFGWYQIMMVEVIGSCCLMNALSLSRIGLKSTLRNKGVEMQAYEKVLKQTLSDVLKVDVSTIDETASVDTIDNWDSLNHLNLVLALEQQFNISFTEEQTVEILNYQLIKAVLKEHGVDFVND